LILDVTGDPNMDPDEALDWIEWQLEDPRYLRYMSGELWMAAGEDNFWSDIY
jgi:hypothetical protein